MKYNVKLIWPWMIACIFCLLTQFVIMIFAIKIWSMSYGQDYTIVVPNVSLWAAQHWYAGSMLIFISFLISLSLNGRPAVVFRNIPLLIVWLWVFCISYSSFLGPMSLHYDSEFELSQFFSFLFGIYPISLLILIVGFGIDLVFSKSNNLNETNPS
jgi:hypothetical protein